MQQQSNNQKDQFFDTLKMCLLASARTEKEKQEIDTYRKSFKNIYGRY